MTACGNKLIIMVAISNEGCVMYECVHLYLVYVCMHGCVCVCKHGYACVYVCICVYVCVDVHSYVCLCVQNLPS